MPSPRSAPVFALLLWGASPLGGAVPDLRQPRAEAPGPELLAALDRALHLARVTSGLYRELLSQLLQNLGVGPERALGAACLRAAMTLEAASFNAVGALEAGSPPALLQAIQALEQAAAALELAVQNLAEAVLNQPGPQGSP